MSDSTTYMVHNAFFEDENADKVFYFTGKSNVIGLPAPDYVYTNEKNYQYIRLLDIICLSEDPIINEDITLVMIPKTRNNLQTTEENSRYVTEKKMPLEINFNIKAQLQFGTSIGKFTFELTTNESDIRKLTYVNDFDAFYEEAKLVEKNFFYIQESKTDDGYKRFSIWYNMDNYITDYWPYRFCLYINKSFSANYTPINSNSFIQGLYYTDYLDDSDVQDQINVANTMPSDISTNIDIECTTITKQINDLTMFTYLIDHVSQDRQYTFLYDALFTPTSTETVVNPTSVKRNSLALNYTDIGISDYNTSQLLVHEPGIYNLQLKNGFYLIQGETRLDVNVYINGDIDEELSLSMYLTSNSETDARKAIKNTFSSPQKVLELHSGDIIEVKVIATNPENIVCENETRLLATYIRTNGEEPKEA